MWSKLALSVSSEASKCHTFDLLTVSEKVREMVGWDDGQIGT